MSAVPSPRQAAPGEEADTDADAGSHTVGAAAAMAVTGAGSGSGTSSGSAGTSSGSAGTSSGSAGASSGSAGAGGSGFAGGAQAWLDGLGGLRDTVRQELVARQLDANLPPGRELRVLDAGCGQGTQALRLARAGHRITGMDADPVMLGALRSALAKEPPEVRERVELIDGDGRLVGRHFGPGSFDVVLCHGVLMYLEQPEPMLAALVRVLSPGGLLSILVRNGDALAMRPGLAGDWAGALGAFGSDRYTNRLGLATRADSRSALARTLRDLGAPVREWYGVRLFTDSAPDDAAVPPVPAALERLLAAEEEAGRRDPYRAVAALLHLCAIRG